MVAAVGKRSRRAQMHRRRLPARGVGSGKMRAQLSGAGEAGSGDRTLTGGWDQRGAGKSVRPITGYDGGRSSDKTRIVAASVRELETGRAQRSLLCLTEEPPVLGTCHLHCRRHRWTLRDMMLVTRSVLARRRPNRAPQVLVQYAVCSQTGAVPRRWRASGAAGRTRVNGVRSAAPAQWRPKCS